MENEAGDINVAGTGGVLGFNWRCRGEKLPTLINHAAALGAEGG